MDNELVTDIWIVNRLGDLFRKAYYNLLESGYDPRYCLVSRKTLFDISPPAWSYVFLSTAYPGIYPEIEKSRCSSIEIREDDNIPYMKCIMVGNNLSKSTSAIEVFDLGN